MSADADLEQAISAFGTAAKAKLAGDVGGGRAEPEAQLRAPIEALLYAAAEALGLPRSRVLVQDEVARPGEGGGGVRPDFSVAVHDAHVGLVEVKRPGKGADPRRLTDRHDRDQWAKLASLPNVLYTDGNAFALCRDGEVVQLAHLDGDVESAGSSLRPQNATKLAALFESFLQWEPTPPRDAKTLAEVAARLCKVLRIDVLDRLRAGDELFHGLRADWRKLLFPRADNEQFADGYAQAVTFGLLTARAKGISLDDNLETVARELGRSQSLIGTALRLLVADIDRGRQLATSLDTLVRVLGVVDWQRISKGSPEAWLYFYEDFLQVYDPEKRKLTGSYYTPPEVVTAMVRLTDELLRDPARHGLAAGLASPAVHMADPAVGTGTFLLGLLRQIAAGAAADGGAGTVPAAVRAAVGRIYGFELQLGPFAVAQLRVLAELADLMGTTQTPAPNLYVTDTLGNPYVEQEQIAQTYEPIAQSRREANRIKREQPITVVIGNPPYKEKMKGWGGWIESGDPNQNFAAPLDRWRPPASWGVAAVKQQQLLNLYVYFWRWATWKVFDSVSDGQSGRGVVCYITVSSFLNGVAYERMREYLRQTCDDLWVIDCSPEGFRPKIKSRIFQGVKHSVCIVIASRSTGDATPARVHYRSLPEGDRRLKFDALTEVTLKDGWLRCPDDLRSAFLPTSSDTWQSFVPLGTFFDSDHSGVMPGRVWPIAPDAESLVARWARLQAAAPDEAKELFRPHLRNGKAGDKHLNKAVPLSLPGFPPRPVPVAKDDSPMLPPVPYALRTLDRQWIIPDNRLLNSPSPKLWAARSDKQIFLTAPHDQTPDSGPAMSLTDLIPDLHHYHGRGGRAYPLYRDAGGTLVSNVNAGVRASLAETYGRAVSGEDVMAYLAAVAAHPAYTARFAGDLVKPGLRVPLTGDADLFAAACDVGRRVVWLHTFGERFTGGPDRPAGRPRLPAGERPTIPRDGAIPDTPDDMPDEIDYDPALRRLRVGAGHVDNVPPAVWAYRVSSDTPLLRSWFSYRKRDRTRPTIGDRRPPSKLNDTRPDRWPAEYTADLLDLLNVLGLLVKLEPEQASLLEQICAGPLIDAATLAPVATRPAARQGIERDEGAQRQLSELLEPEAEG